MGRGGDDPPPPPPPPPPRSTGLGPEAQAWGTERERRREREGLLHPRRVRHTFQPHGAKLRPCFAERLHQNVGLLWALGINHQLRLPCVHPAPEGGGGAALQGHGAVQQGNGGWGVGVGGGGCSTRKVRGKRYGQARGRTDDIFPGGGGGGWADQRGLGAPLCDSIPFHSVWLLFL